MLARSDEADSETPVRKEDQLKINEFGRLNTQLQELGQDRAVCQKALDQLEAAEEEVMMVEGGEDGLK